MSRRKDPGTEAVSMAVMTVPERHFLGFRESVDAWAPALSDGVEVFGFTSGGFSLIDILAALIRHMNGPRMVVSTWTAAGAEMQHVHDFLESGGISSARWIVDRSFQNRQPQLCASLRAKFGDEAIRVQRVHSKFALLDDGDLRITVQTSANLNKNRRIENLCVSPCPVFFAAYAELVERIFGTQMPGAGFEADSAVTASFNEVTRRGKRRKSNSRPNPWQSE